LYILLILSCKNSLYCCRFCNKVFKYCKLFDRKKNDISYVFNEYQRKTITGMSTPICDLWIMFLVCNYFS